MTLQLDCCYIAKEQEPCFITIEIDLTANVDTLSQAIYKQLKLRGRNADVPLKPLEDLNTRAAEWHRAQTAQPALHPFEKLKGLFPPPLSDVTLHIIADAVRTCPNPFADPGVHFVPKHPFPATLKRSASSESSWPRKKRNVELPQLQDLISYLSEPIPESEKIPVGTEGWRELLEGNDGSCTLQDVKSVFRLVGEDFLDGSRHIFITAASLPLPVYGTEDNFHSAWDRNIRFILEFFVPSGRAIRNSNRHTHTRGLRPDFGYLINAACPFRGEEKSPSSSDDPRQELSDKLNWIYDPSVPYILAYYAVGSEVTIVALSPPLHQPGGNPVIHNLVSVDLRSEKQRIQNLLHMINLCHLLEPLSQLMSLTGSELISQSRKSCEIEITSVMVAKIYKDRGKVAKLCSIYDTLKLHQVPNTDHILYTEGNSVRLQPRGKDTRPRDERELRDCLRCVLQTLVAIHKIPLYHRDIRPENVIQTIHNRSKWFLIDWEDASGEPTQAQVDFSRGCHSPDVFHDGHGASVDIWGVGFLVAQSSIFGLSENLRSWAADLQERAKEVSAEDALAALTAMPRS